MGLKPILRITTSFSALTLSVGSFDPKKRVPDMTYNVFSGTLNPTQSLNHGEKGAWRTTKIGNHTQYTDS